MTQRVPDSRRFWRPSHGVLAGLLLAALWATAAFADHRVDAVEPVVISDDIYNRTTAVESSTAPPSGSIPGAGVQGSAMGAPPGGAAAPDPDAHTKSNNGHGNNADGVDSSNPGQGNGGPNGADDPSCGSGGCVDDESTGGGSVMSQGQNP